MMRIFFFFPHVFSMFSKIKDAIKLYPQTEQAFKSQEKRTPYPLPNKKQIPRLPPPPLVHGCTVYPHFDSISINMETYCL